MVMTNTGVRKWCLFH